LEDIAKKQIDLHDVEVTVG